MDQRIRIALLLVTIVGIVGTALQLAIERHWGELFQLPPWLALALALIAVAALWVRPGVMAARFARAVAVVAIVVAAAGVVLHFNHNYEHATASEEASDGHGHSHGSSHAHDDEGDGGEASYWDVLSGAERSVPLLAPGALAQIALTLALATVGVADASRRE